MEDDRDTEKISISAPDLASAYRALRDYAANPALSGLSPDQAAELIRLVSSATPQSQKEAPTVHATLKAGKVAEYRARLADTNVGAEEREGLQKAIWALIGYRPPEKMLDISNLPLKGTSKSAHEKKTGVPGSVVEIEVMAGDIVEDVLIETALPPETPRQEAQRLLNRLLTDIEIKGPEARTCFETIQKYISTSGTRLTEMMKLGPDASEESAWKILKESVSAAYQRSADDPRLETAQREFFQSQADRFASPPSSSFKVAAKPTPPHGMPLTAGIAPDWDRAARPDTRAPTVSEGMRKDTVVDSKPAWTATALPPLKPMKPAPPPAKPVS